MGQRLDLYARCKDERLIPVEIGLGPVELPDGRATLASIIDISERKRYEDELRRSNIELEQFAYVASHDLQEPLRVAAMYAEILGTRYEQRLDAAGKRYLSYVGDAARRMQKLVADLLKYSTMGSTEQPRVPTPVDEVVRVAQAQLKVAFDESEASLEVGSLPTVHAVASQLVQVFQNLIGNCLKFRSEAPLQIRSQAARRDADWMFSVADNGIGLDMKYAERVFAMFQRLRRDDRTPGSGIGLAIVRRIVEAHGGRVWIESEPNQGATVYFTLPAGSDSMQGER
jgi:light-regulated signal transduction histidine kinase (bacteriophytochrome)